MGPVTREKGLAKKSMVGLVKNFKKPQNKEKELKNKRYRVERDEEFDRLAWN